MSDYISIKDDSFWQILFDEACIEGKQAERIQKELEQISVDEKEIIRKPFERVVERLEEQRLNEYSARAEYVNGMNGLSKCYLDVRIETLEKTIEIVKEECGISE